MLKMVPIAITILKMDTSYLFLKRKNPPYENLWSLVGGKVAIGEHIHSAAVREVMEETGTTSVNNFHLRGVVSERLLSKNHDLVAHFIIFVGHAEIESHIESHREGELRCFTNEDIFAKKDSFLPSDYEMLSRFTHQNWGAIEYHEAELVQDEGTYHLNYYREVND